MARTDNLYELPPDLPVPIDDGACDHLPGARLPAVSLASTSGRAVNLGALPELTVIYCYPRTGRPDVEMPKDWNQIPGARGCTPQACAFRDHYQELRQLGAQVFGLSTQTTDDQRETVERLHLPMELLSDTELRFARALRLPTFEVESMVLIKRLTLVALHGRIIRLFYPVFPPDKNAGDVIAWIRTQPPRSPTTPAGHR